MRLPSRPHSRIPVSTAMCGERCRSNNSVSQAGMHLHDCYAVMAAKVDRPPCKLLPLRARDRPDRRSRIKQTCGRCDVLRPRSGCPRGATDCTPQSVGIDWSQHICARSHCAALSEFSGPSERAARTVIRQPGRGIAVCRALHRRCAHRQVICPLQPLPYLPTGCGRYRQRLCRKQKRHNRKRSASGGVLGVLCAVPVHRSSSRRRR
jgi:hypothetical protein